MLTQGIQKTLYKVSDFISWQKSDSLILSPKFQRRAVWKPGAKSYLIDTIVRGWPIPIIFLRDIRTDLNQIEPKREVVDGQQRLRTIIGFIAPNLLKDFNPEFDSFTVKKTHNKDIAGKRFKDLDDATKRAILDYEFSVHVLSSNVDDREIIQIFRRMNSTNYALTKQEIRNATYHGEFKTSVFGLAEEQLQRWIAWGTFSNDNIARMVEVEHTTECVIAIMEGKISGKSNRHIETAYKNFDETFPNRTEIERRFRTVMNEIDKGFSQYAATFKFVDRRLIYIFFFYVYSLVYSGHMTTLKRVKPRSLAQKEITRILRLSDKISEERAGTDVLESAARRTTNPKERGILLQYLKG
ncbi:MAG: DUF262 domain-containing protein [candidate division Zixibacteria bacterium]|nr:DUF262 domain-containing protein [candidate division Zixibacteria bacterium]